MIKKSLINLYNQFMQEKLCNLKAVKKFSETIDVFSNSLKKVKKLEQIFEISDFKN